MDFGATPTLIGTIPVSGVTVRNIAYDEVNDGFWCGNWADPVTLFDRTGTQLDQIVTGLPGQYGSAYDNVSPGGPFLWVFDQGTGAGTPQLIHQFDIATGLATGVTHDVTLDVIDPAGIGGGLWTSTDHTPGFLVMGALLQGVPDEMVVYEIAPSGPPCPVGQATDPTPPSGATGVPLTGNTASWVNGAGATEIEVFFDGVSVYTGPPITSLSLAGVEPLDYSTTYTWKVNGSDGTCWTFGLNWTFTTIDDPNIVNLFCDDFTAGLGGWTITNDGGTCVWDIFQTTDYTLPPTAAGNVMAADADFCGSGTTLLSTATLNSAIDATMFGSVWLEFDNDWQAINAADFAYVDVSTDGGTTWMNVLTFDEIDIRNTHEIWDMTSMVALSNFNIRFVSVQPGWDWWWAVDNVCIYGSDPIPVELTSFTATADYGVVNLQWITATETNNQGFEVQRSNGSDFEAIAFVDGHGTTTQSQAYTYSDKSVEVGSYTYRLKQVDFDGTFEYSNVIEVDVPAPAEFGLDQNYPNPFNPSTKIAFQLAVDSKVSLKIFDVLGQEVATLVNTNLVAGSHNVNFDASALNSGVYLYRIEATGIDGANFIDVKKMILTK